MKKIVSIVAVAAVLASSVFAADVAAKVKLYGSLLDVAGKDVKAFTLNGHDSQPWETELGFSFSEDKCGAAFGYETAEGVAFDGDDWSADAKINAKIGNNVASCNWNIWFKPFDMLKINLGGVDVALNKETIDWSSISAVAGNGGYGVELNTNGFFLGAYLDQGWGNSWFAGKAVNKTALKVAYSADFGTISGMFVLNNKDSFKAGAAFAGAFGDGFNMFLDVVYDKAKTLDIDVFANYSAGAMGVKVYVLPKLNFNDGADTFAGLCYKFRFDYNVNGLGIYFYSASGDVLADPLALTFKPGLTGSCGAMGWEAAVQCGLTGSDFSLSIPVNFTVNF